MSSQRSREEERHLSIATLVIASIASATAALITSQFWQGGTPIAAAVTPVIVALVSELLHRPTAKIAERMTSERDALPPDAPASRRSPEGMSVPRSGPIRRGLSLKVVAATAALAFVIAAAALTLPELIAGQSLGNPDRGTTIFAGKERAADRGSDEPSQATDESEPTETQPQTTEESSDTDPERTAPEEPTDTDTETAPQPKKAPRQTAPETAPPQPRQ